MRLVHVLDDLAELKICVVEHQQSEEPTCTLTIAERRAESRVCANWKSSTAAESANTATRLSAVDDMRDWTDLSAIKRMPAERDAQACVRHERSRSD